LPRIGIAHWDNVCEPRRITPRRIVSKPAISAGGIIPQVAAQTSRGQRASDADVILGDVLDEASG